MKNQNNIISLGNSRSKKAKLAARNYKSQVERLVLLEEDVDKLISQLVDLDTQVSEMHAFLLKTLRKLDRHVRSGKSRT